MWFVSLEDPHILSDWVFACAQVDAVGPYLPLDSFVFNTQGHSTEQTTQLVDHMGSASSQCNWPACVRLNGLQLLHACGANNLNAALLACRVSWNPFISNYSAVAGYQYQIFGYEQSTITGKGGVITQPASRNFSVGANVFSGVADGLMLRVGDFYAARVCATSEAGLTKCADSAPVEVKPMGSTISTSEVAIIVAASIGVGSIIVACITVYIVRTR